MPEAAEGLVHYSAKWAQQAIREDDRKKKDFVDNVFHNCQNSIPNIKNIENINKFFLLHQSGEQIEDVGPPVVQLFLSDKKNNKNISEESFQAFIDPGSYSNDT